MITPETAGLWRAFCDTAIEASLAGEREPVMLRASRVDLQHMRRPDTALAEQAFLALLFQVDLYCAAPPRARADLAPVLKALAEQAYRLIDGWPADWRAPSYAAGSGG